MSINNNKSKVALGKGIKALLNDIDEDLKKGTNPLNNLKQSGIIVGERIPIDYIEPNPNQPRKDFDEDTLRELAESIKIHDIIQPITVIKIGNNKYQIIAGERRWRASIIAGIKDIPAYIRTANSQQKLEWGLLENLQREDLNAMEIALGYKQLMEECDLTQEQVGERMNKNRSTITNYLRLLKLPPNIQVAIRNADISMGHAKVITGLTSIESQLYMYDEIIKKGLSVRQTEELSKQLQQERKPSSKPMKTKVDPEVVAVQKKIEDFFGSKSQLKMGKNGKGSIIIDFYSNDDLSRILDKLDK